MVVEGTVIVSESKKGRSSDIKMGSSIACYRVGSLITFFKELNRRRSLRLWKLDLKGLQSGHLLLSHVCKIISFFYIYIQVVKEVCICSSWTVKQTK